MGIRLLVRALEHDPSGEPAEYEFEQSRVVIGRSAGSDIQLPHSTVSSVHATVRTHDQGYAIVDEESTNGTKVNGTRIVPLRPKVLRSGDTLSVCGFVLEVQVGVAVVGSTSAERTAALARRFVREALRASASQLGPRFVVLNGPDEGSMLAVPDPPVRLLIGRAETCDLALQDADTSREHAEVIHDLDGVLVRDLESKNGIAVEGKRVVEWRCRDRDEIRLGATTLAFEDPVVESLRAIQVADDELAGDELMLPGREDETESSLVAESSPSEPASLRSARGDSEPRGLGQHGASPTRKTRSHSASDVAIYVLAGVIFLLSMMGLFVLFRAR